MNNSSIDFKKLIEETSIQLRKITLTASKIFTTALGLGCTIIVSLTLIWLTSLLFKEIFCPCPDYLPKKHYMCECGGELRLTDEDSDSDSGVFIYHCESCAAELELNYRIEK